MIAAKIPITILNGQLISNTGAVNGFFHVGQPSKIPVQAEPPRVNGAVNGVVQVGQLLKNLDQTETEQGGYVVDVEAMHGSVMAKMSPCKQTQASWKRVARSSEGSGQNDGNKIDCSSRGPGQINGEKMVLGKWKKVKEQAGGNTEGGKKNKYKGRSK